jgi:CBS-domain-containing membrane protein
MREHQIRRLPVVDKAEKLIGILSMSDIAREAERLRASKSKKRPLKDSDLIETLGAICSRSGNGAASHAA